MLKSVIKKSDERRGNDGPWLYKHGPRMNQVVLLISAVPLGSILAILLHSVV